MKSVLRNLLFFLVIVSLISCASGTQTLTAMPSSTPVPSVTPTLTIEPTFTPTERPKSAVDEIFALPTMGPYVDASTMPIAIPEFLISSAKLREMSEKDYLELIRQMQESSYKNYPPGIDGWPRSRFIEAQRPVALTIQEYLYRFPDGPNAKRLHWQLTFINSLTSSNLGGNQYGDTWILAKLENMLDQGEATPDALGNILGQYSFNVYDVQPIKNLFQDGETGWLYMIAPKILADWNNGGGGLFFVVREINKNDFQIFLLNSTWNFAFGTSSVFEVSDHNQNGTPEIALNIGAHSGSMCNGNFLIYEWNKSAFMELTRGQIEVRDCSDEYKYYTNTDGKPSILYSGFLSPRTSLFVWNGEYYEPEHFISADLVETWANSSRFSAEEEKAIEAILSSNNTKDLTPTHFDFLKFRLGLVYALESKVEEAKIVLQDLADNPSDSSRTIYSDFAKNFLKYYSGDETLYLACEQSRKILDETDWQDNWDILGIDFDIASPYGPGLLRCFDSDVFELFIHNLPVSVKDVRGELRRNGAKLYYAEKQDLDLDGALEELLIVFDDGVYAVFSNGLVYETVDLDYFWYGGDTSTYSKMTAEVDKWSGVQDPVLTISTDRDLLIMGIGEGYDPMWKGYEFGVEDVILSPYNDPAQYQVFYSKPVSKDDYSDGPWKGYRWDNEHQKFKDDLLEYTLFIARDPRKAVAMTEEIAPLVLKWEDLDYWWLPKYLYLCGLSYELAGDNQTAAKIYWQLWHDFPESQYALIAKYKLEPVTP